MAGRIAVTPSSAHQRIELSELAKGWKIGGCGFCKGFGTTPTALMTPSSTPAPHFAVVSSVHGVGRGGIFPVLALVGEHRLGPAFLDDAEAFLEGGAVGGVDLVVLVQGRGVDAVRLLRHHVDPAPLVAAREAGAGAPARHVVEHGDVLGDADRVRGRQHDAELADADALRLHRRPEVEQHRVVRELEPLDVEVVLGEADRVVAEIVGQPDLLGHIAQHPLVEVRPHASEAGFDLRQIPGGRKIEQ
jgi:hypothetical protein